MTTSEKRARLIETLYKIIKDLEQGYGGFLYLYDSLCMYRTADQILRTHGDQK